MPPADGGVPADDQGGGGGSMFRMVLQMVCVMAVVQLLPKPAPDGSDESEVAQPSRHAQIKLTNLFGEVEECDLFVYYSMQAEAPGADALANASLAAEHGYELLWHTRVWYRPDAEERLNATIGPLSAEALAGERLPFLHAFLLRAALVGSAIPPEEIVYQSLPLVAMLRQLSDESSVGNLFSEASAPAPLPKGSTVPYFKTKVEIRPVVDQTVHTPNSLSDGPLRSMRWFPHKSAYQPYLYLSDFWLLEKDYIPVNHTLAGTRLNISLTYSPTSLLVWTVQAKMAEQWTQKSDFSLTDTQRDSFMLKRLYLDTNPYVLAFSAAFLMLHTVFSMLAFKNEIQFWRQNESMQGLSARSMCISYVTQLITALYLLDSQETSRLILFEILINLSIATWTLRKAIKIEVKPRFPFLVFANQKGYENAGTNRYDEEALRCMGAVMTPLFVGYAIRSAVYEKHRGWYSFLVSTAAGGVYTFGFAMLTPQLYINYKLQSVEHMPWRALTYKAMNTFVDDVAAFLIDMPMMHRLSCFRDDIVFFVYLFQRWKYSVDKARPTMWSEPPVASDSKSAPALAAPVAPAIDCGVASAEAPAEGNAATGDR